MFLFEFNGLPGCGKSTVSESVILRCSGLKLKSYDLEHERMPSGFFKRALYILRFWNFREIIQLCRISKCVNYSSYITQIKRIVVAEQICVNYRRLYSESGVCVIDQGLVQAIASVLYIYDINDRNKLDELIRSIILRYQSKLIIINAISSANTAKERIRFRNFDHGSRMNYIKEDDQLVEHLQRQLDNIAVIRDSISKCGATYIDIDMCNNVEKNTKELLEYIHGLIK